MTRSALVRRLATAVAGHDAFVSYSRADGAAYARALAAALEARGLLVCFDATDFDPGDSLTGTLARRVRRSRRLVLIDTPGARRSRYVGQEIAHAVAVRRPVLRVSGATGNLPPWQFVNPDTAAGDPIWIDEPAALSAGVPSDAVVATLVRTAHASRAVRRFAWAAAGAVLILAAVVAAAMRVAWVERQVATSQRLASESLRVSVSAPADALRLAIAAADTWATDDARRALAAALSHHALELTIHETAPVIHAALSMDGSLVVSVLSDGTHRIWDLAGGVPALEIAFDASAAALWSADLGVRLVELCRTRGVRLPGMSPDCTRLLTAAADDRSTIWEVASGKRMVDVAGSTLGVAGAAFSPDSMLVATLDGSGIRLSASVDGRLVRALRGCHEGVGVNGLAWSADGSRLASAGDEAACVWDVSRGTRLHRVAEDTEGVRSAQFSPDGARLVTASGDHIGRVWRLDTGLVERSLSDHQAPLTFATFSPDGARIVTTSANLVVYPPEADEGLLRAFDPAARVWDAHTGALLRVLRLYEDGVQHAAFGPDGRTVVTAGDSETRVWRDGGRSAGPLTPSTLVATQMASDETPDGLRVVDDLVVRDARSRVPQLTLEPPPDTRLIRTGVSADGRTVVGVFEAGLRRWDARSGAVIGDVPFEEMGDVTRAVISPDGRRVAVLHHYRDIRLFDLETGATLDLSGQSAAWSPDSQRIVTVLDRERNASVWSAATGLRVLDLPDGADGFTDAQFSADGQWVATTGFDDQIRIWDLSTGVEIDVFAPESVSGVGFTTDGDLVAGDRVYPVRLDALLRLARARAPRTLSPAARP